MAERDLEKLLGAFATDTLTAEERRALFEAALRDQALFDALADEQALKELLNDPVSRRRILAALERPPATTTTSWAARFTEWFRRPVNAALAGGLAAAVVAIVVGTRLYEETLRTSVPPMAAEDAKPPTQAPAPASTEPQARHEPRTLVPKSEPAAPEAPARAIAPRAEQKAAPEQEEPAPQAGRLPPKADLPSPAAPPSAPQQAGPAASAPTMRALGAIGAAPVSARALFYGEGRRTMAETPRAPTGESAYLEERDIGAKPLGFRYSFLLRGRDGRDVEVDSLAAFTKRDHPRLTIETNDHGYLFVWYEERPGTASLFFPPPPPPPNKEQQPEGPEVTAGTRYVIPLPVGPMREGVAPRGRLFILFSREPEMDITDLASVVERSKPGAKSLVIEHVDPSRLGSPDERAVYVVNPDPAANARLVVDIPLASH
ncbi:MAG: hypothetical protein AB1555_07530 [Nitrospirota bacterium]